MISYEFLKNKQLLNALDEPFDIFYLIMWVSDLCNEDETIQNKTLDIIRYFLDSGLFEILDPYNNSWHLSRDEAMEKIKKLWNASSMDGSANIHDSNMWLSFKLTPAGILAAKEHLLRHIHAREKVLLLATDKKYINLLDVINIVKENLPIQNAEELQLETFAVLEYLWGNDGFVEIGDLNEAGQFVSWSGYFRAKSKEHWNALEGEPKNEVAWLRITPEAKKLVEEWKIKGGRLIPEWYTYIDKK